ncbi:MAG: hypothetical protein J6E42_07345 [Firmicutes bacterium]|nr:hypothetical protein [Bacillota bacterium]
MNTQETQFIYDVDVEVSLLNENGHLKPHAYQFLIADVAGRHLSRFHVNADSTIKYGLSWALISLHVQVIRPVNGCEHLRARTWHSGTKGPYFRRELLFCDDEGNTVFQAVTFSILLDVKNRSILRPKVLDTLPIHLPDPNPEFLFDARATRKIQMEYELSETRKVYNSYLDLLGHVNNCRYSEFAYDTFTAEEKARLADLKRMEVYFESELRPQDTFTIGRAAEGSSLFFRGHNNVKADTSFDVVMTFGEDSI